MALSRAVTVATMGLVAALLIPTALSMQPLINQLEDEEGEVVFISNMAITSSTDTRRWVVNDFARDEELFFRQFISTSVEKLAHLLGWNHGEVRSDYSKGNNGKTVDITIKEFAASP